jgi:hypothetical protein
LEDRLPAGHRYPAADRDVDIGGGDLEAPGASSSELCRDQGRARAQEAVEHNVSRTGHVADRVGDQGRGLHRRVKRQVLASAAGEAVDRGGFPDIGSSPAMLAQLDRVEVLGTSYPIDGDQLVLRTIK